MGITHVKFRCSQVVCLGLLITAGIMPLLLDIKLYGQIFEKQSQIFVCIKFMNESCSLAKIIATSLFSNSSIYEYIGQKSKSNDILITVCGCNHADLFKGIILYIDNAAGNLYLPGLKEKKVVYIGSTMPTPESLVLYQWNISFAVTLFHTVFSKNSLTNIDNFIENTGHRFFAVYLSNYVFESNEIANIVHKINQTVTNSGIQPFVVKDYFDLINGSLANFQNAIDFIKRYRFTLVVENQNSGGFVGEKILLSILAGSVPIFIGTRDVLEFFNEDAIIYVDTKKNIKTSIDRLVFLEKNHKEYRHVIKAPLQKDNNSKWFSIDNDNAFKKSIAEAIKNGQTLLTKNRGTPDIVLRYNTIKKLEHEPVLFYMYDDPDIALPTLESDCPNPVVFSDKTDITLIKLFKKHHWRTHNASNAKLFVIPTPFYESYTCNPKTHEKRLNKSLSALLANDHFRRLGGRNHLLMAYHWRFGYNSPEVVIPKMWWEKLKEVVCTRFEYYGMSNFENLTVNDERRVPLSLFTIKYENSKRTIIVSYNVWEGINITTPDYSEWRKRRNFFYYHTRTAGSNHGGTPLRHLPVKKSDHFPGDIGFEIESKKWISGWTNSKFCLVIRGDTPSSHAFTSAISTGCIPVIISDTFELVAMPHKELIPVESIALHISESFFLENSSSLYKYLKSLPEMKIITLLSNLKFVQHIILLRHPNCTLPNLILHELKLKVENLYAVH